MALGASGAWCSAQRRATRTWRWSLSMTPSSTPTMPRYLIACKMVLSITCEVGPPVATCCRSKQDHATVVHAYMLRGL